MAFREVIGHRRLLTLISRSIARDTLPPSLLFAGPPGVGKRLVAVSTAQALNCLARPEPQRPEAPPARGENLALFEKVGTTSPEHLAGCGVCRACVRIARGVHPDVIVVEPGDSGSIKIDVIRDVIDRANYRPFEGRRRVVIIDEADALVPPAQNALLKTLEEPPSASVFILVSSRPDALLPTVRSRLPKLRFQPLLVDEVARALVERGRTEEEARAVAATADGSIGRALQATAGDLVEARDVALRVLTHAAAGDEPRRRIEGAKELLGKGDTVDRAQLAVYLRAIASLLRDVAVLATGADVRALANPDVRRGLDRLTAFHGDRSVRAFAAVDTALAALDRNAGVKVVSDWVLVNL
jgi:DNA polymerase-3 subunit delta'